MNKAELLNSINESLEDTLAKCYDQNNIAEGDITPAQSAKWDKLVSEMADLFIELAEQNK